VSSVPSARPNYCFCFCKMSGVISLPPLQLPVNVSYIECHGQVGHDMELTNIEGNRNYQTKNGDRAAPSETCPFIFCILAALDHSV
jgi:hypothetical protein